MRDSEYRRLSQRPAEDLQQQQPMGRGVCQLRAWERARAAGGVGGVDGDGESTTVVAW